MKKVVKHKGFRITLYEKSIGTSLHPNVYWIGRTPTEDDAVALAEWMAAAYKLGKEAKQSEIRAKAQELYEMIIGKL